MCLVNKFMIKNHNKNMASGFINYNGKGLTAKMLVFAFALLGLGVFANAQTAMVTRNFVAYPVTPDTTNFQCDISTGTVKADPANDRSFIDEAISSANVQSLDPWVNSALIEYDQPFPDAVSANLYPNHCLTLCADVTCVNPLRKATAPNGTEIVSEASGDFPIQTIYFQIFKYQKNGNPYNVDSTPPVRTIAIYPQDEGNICNGVGIYNKSAGETDYKATDSKSCCDTTYCNFVSGEVTSDTYKTCASTCKAFQNSVVDVALEQCEAGKTYLNFCTSWDGMFEIDGEFGKSNGQYGYRATIKSDWPGDGISTAQVTVDHTVVYPGENQIPIQVDVTNIHSVRSSATLVGSNVIVGAQPYKLSYRLSKDSLMTIRITDPSSDELQRTLIQNEPRLGEGQQGGAETDTAVTEQEAWDGRDNQGLLLPYGNYVVSFQAQSQDEWSGTEAYDLSRTTTRQLSLDPLKITDIAVTGLTKTSTAYAMLSYMLTEAATVHTEIYSPGTSFTGDINMVNGDGTVKTNIGAPINGYKLAEVTEQKGRRVGVNTKWDGMCWNAEGCQDYGYNVGAALPDGDYVYVVWAEMPYPNGQTKTINDITWDGVKTRIFYTGSLPVQRGLPEIYVEPVGQSTIGSSPTAFGLDPFIFRYSLSRDSIVTAEVVTTSDNGTATTEDTSYVVKTLINNQVQASINMNVFTWDGKDDNGRYVSPGTYMFRVVAKDSLFPEKQVTSTVQFPIDLFRVVDVAATPIMGDATSQASISYALSKSMDVTLDIYAKNVIIPNPNDNTKCAWPPVPCASQPVTVDTNTCCIYYDPSNIGTYPIAPVKSYTGTRPGDGVMITELWDGLLYNESNASSQEVMADGMYPYMIYAKADVASSLYYKVSTTTANPVPQAAEFVSSQDATDRPTGYITVARGPVYFTSIKISPTQPQLHYSSETIYIPTYEVQFAVTRTAKVTVEVRSNSDNVCTDSNGNTGKGVVCRTLTATSFASGGTVLNSQSIYEAEVVNKLYWDGKDEKGNYVKTDAFEVRFTAVPYPQPSGAAATANQTVESRILNVNNFQVFDRYVWDVSPSTKGVGKFAYQISVPMKVAIQILKPNTRIANPSEGTLIDPATGAVLDESNIKAVLVKAIIGTRPHLVAIEDVWDGTDYAGQKVPDGAYPFRYVTVLNSYDMDSITGAITNTATPIQQVVADWDKFINLNIINVANGDSWYADLDWKDNKVTMFFPNPLKQDFGQFEITKVPAPGYVTIKIYNIAGDLVREGGYNCINAIGVTATLEQINAEGGIKPDWTTNGGGSSAIIGGRNFALRCTWDRTNQSGRKVARGLYYAIMTLDPTYGNASKSQKVIKILIP